MTSNIGPRLARTQGRGWLAMSRTGLALLMVGALFSSLIPGAAAQDDAAYGYGWVFNYNPGEASYEPDALSQYNSTGAVNTVENTGEGEYTVTMPGLGIHAGNVQVSTVFGDGTQTCHIANYEPAGSDQVIQVSCVDQGAAPLNSYFMLTFTNADPAATVEDGTFGAYALAYEQENADGYTPDPRFTWNSSGGGITVRQNDTGFYTVTAEGFAGDGGTPQITAAGGDAGASTLCNAGGTRKTDDTTLESDVICMDVATGDRANSWFSWTYSSGNAPLGYPMGDAADSAWLLDYDQTLDGTFTPDAAANFNSTGGANSVDRLGTGDYSVRLEGLSGGEPNGVAIVTSHSDAYVTCTIAEPGANDTDAFVGVQCFDIDLAPVDSGFSMSYIRSAAEPATDDAAAGDDATTDETGTDDAATGDATAAAEAEVVAEDTDGAAAGDTANVAGASQEVSTGDATYYWELNWNASWEQIEDENSPLTLQSYDGDTLVAEARLYDTWSLGVTAPDAATCLANELGYYPTDSRFSDIQALTDADGNPRAGEGDGYAWAAQSYLLDGNETTSLFVCWEMGDENVVIGRVDFLSYTDDLTLGTELFDDMIINDNVVMIDFSGTPTETDAATANTAPVPDTGDEAFDTNTEATRASSLEYFVTDAEGDPLTFELVSSTCPFATVEPNGAYEVDVPASPDTCDLVYSVSDGVNDPVEGTVTFRYESE